MVITMTQGHTDLQTRSSRLADGRAMVTRRIHASADDVWSVLADGWLYANWVVGASRVRDVDEHWPQPGSRLHHSFGAWPILIDDHTEVVSCDPGRELLLKARGRPVGEAHVQIKVSAAGTHGSVVSIAEDATGGPGRLLPRPARQLLITPRNTEALRRLALIAEGRHKADLLSAPSPTVVHHDHIDSLPQLRRRSG